ncbi:hypothetical protein K525DRAFT_257042, partial [Schizophyllum commune Loenen D]
DGRLCLSFFGTRAGGCKPSASQFRHRCPWSPRVCPDKRDLLSILPPPRSIKSAGYAEKYTPLFMNVVRSAQHSPRLTAACDCSTPLIITFS